MTPHLEFARVCKTYRRGERPAVSEVNLVVKEGEILALLGESGSGKSTLLRLAAGLEAPDSGVITLSGGVLASDDAWIPPEARDIGLVFQDGALFPHLSVARNVSYALSGLSKKDRKSKIATLLELVGLAGKEKRFPHELSGGEQQRLAIVRSLAAKPKVLLLDEPFGSLDPSLRRDLRAELRDLFKQVDSTVVVVTHDPEDTLAISDRVAIIREGQIECVGDTQSIYQNAPNKYSAHLFGPANGIAISANETRWVRPEYMKLRPVGPVGIPVEIVGTSMNCGSRYALARPSDSRFTVDNSDWLISLASDQHVHARDSYCIKIPTGRKG